MSSSTPLPLAWAPPTCPATRYCCAPGKWWPTSCTTRGARRSSLPLSKQGLGRSRGSACSCTRPCCSSSCGQVSLPMSPSCGQRQSGSWHRGASSLELMLRYLTAGESHGQALVVIIEGLPAGLPITVEEIQAEMARRRLGYGRGPRQKFEQDDLTLLGGVRHGRT